MLAQAATPAVPWMERSGPLPCYTNLTTGKLWLTLDKPLMCLHSCSTALKLLFAARLYGQPHLTDVNDHEARYKLLCAKGCSSFQLPPCRDALQLHVRRANFQAAVWRMALQATPKLPSPHGHGGLSRMELLALTYIEWTTQLPAPEQLLELISCRCKRGCQSRQCSCLANGMLCTDACQCSDCTNSKDADKDSLAEESDRQSDSDASDLN